ncbi:MAG: hypothetical protein GXO79_06035 [Chlorobi bacterium]|nr:hypothetical protein [Chlorobiota bacterium]
MKNKFETEKFEKKLKNIRWISVLLIIVGVIKFTLEDYSNINSYRSLGSLIDSLIFPILGIAIYISNTKKIKLIAGSYLLFENDGFAFKSRQIERKFNLKNDLERININLKTIELFNTENDSFVIHLDDYVEFKDKKEIKEKFKSFVNELETKPNKKINSIVGEK